MRSVYVNWKGKASFSALTYLILYGLAIAIPLVLVLGGLLFRATSLEREQLDLRILQVLDDLVDNLDRDFDRHLTILRTLASSQVWWLRSQCSIFLYPFCKTAKFASY